MIDRWSRKREHSTEKSHYLSQHLLQNLSFSLQVPGSLFKYLSVIYISNQFLHSCHSLALPICLLVFLPSLSLFLLWPPPSLSIFQDSILLSIIVTQYFLNFSLTQSHSFTVSQFWTVSRSLKSLFCNICSKSTQFLFTSVSFC